MFRKFIKIFLFIFVFIDLIFVFWYSKLWKETSLATIELWLYKVVLSIVPVYILSSLLLAFPLINRFLFKLVKRYNFFENEKAFSLFCLGFLTGNPTSAILVKKAYCNGEISLKQANKIFTTCSHVSFLFIFMIFDFNISIILVVSQIISSIFLYLFKCKFSEYKCSNYSNNILDTINSVIDDLPLILLRILSSMLVITLIKLPFMFLDNTFINILLDFLEVTTGIVDFKNLSINVSLKIVLYSMILSLNGGAILLQVFNAIKKTKLNYRGFLITRLVHVTLSSAISLVLFIILQFIY